MIEARLRVKNWVRRWLRPAAPERLAEPQQTIAQLAGGLLASRSAIVGAVDLLTGLTRCDAPVRLGSAPTTSLSPRCIGAVRVQGRDLQAAGGTGARGATAAGRGRTERHSIIEEATALYDFIAERMPQLLDEWRAQRVRLREHD
ncbi:hypothetical protein GCM10010339_82190 [Streptomyces alanosinicus]|uniref:Uncharacterized protein n=1 Tax=Streptomyces alanosinicus TaxID=68171 RepID=A0A919D773_9ACTN|nr:hypothetical protein GCM10010339_82190 [Streptomyces alanosinicus]